ncbi:MAG: cysteine--tRNA ligase [Defluviitaleaceae bacterium]|nr:cysteine--tRNA ligase [Defluviitaleaceae bacterium]
MKIFNTLSRQKEGFVPVNADKIGIYVCGPTVYNFIHVGNARPYVVFDTLRRFLRYKGYDVKYVQNFTDIDDKIINKANAEDTDFLNIANRYIDEFFTDIDGLNVLRADVYPRVTEEIEGIVNLISLLIDKGSAYDKNGTVYFNAHSVNNYGKLSKKNINELESGARVEVNTEKNNPSDFVLWKPAKPNEPYWGSPWSNGRPGWHIECSVMARKYIGDIVDIHAGGEDLMFPHHENEIAQSEAEKDGNFANYWMHNGMLLVDNQKMSKSADNFFLVRDVAKKFGYDVLRFFLLSVHYRSPLNYSAELLEAAANGLERIRNCRRQIEQATENHPYEDEFRASFIDALNDDLNTANAISSIFELVKFVNVALRNGESPNKAWLDDLDFMLDLLGVSDYVRNGSNDDIAVEVEELIVKRNEAKSAKNWDLADEIRGKLTTMGIVMKDTREGTKWHYDRN